MNGFFQNFETALSFHSQFFTIHDSGFLSARGSTALRESPTVKPASRGTFFKGTLVNFLKRNWRRKNSSVPLNGRSAHQTIRKSFLRDFLLPVLGLLGALQIGMLMAPRVGHASSAQPGDNFYETVGISLAVGTILGASTLPFYSQPGSALVNVGIGAGVGAVIGLGIWTYELFFGSSDGSGHGVVEFQLPRSGQVSILNPSEFRSTSVSLIRNASFTPTLLWLPVVSINW